MACEGDGDDGGDADDGVGDGEAASAEIPSKAAMEYTHTIHTYIYV